MNSIASDQRIEAIIPVQSPQSLFEVLPLPSSLAEQIIQTRLRISRIIHGEDKRLLVIVGPCSIHDTGAALEYANRLNPLRKKYSDTLEIVMRVYFEKPRSTVGWKGLINDPNLDDSCQIDKGLHKARKLLLQLAELGLPAGCEFLDTATGQFYADTVSWGAIGARTTESQVHREMASGLSCPVGFKNGTKGNIDIALDAMLAASHSHTFLSPDTNGQLAMYRTAGNSDAHLILRGGNEPNYQSHHLGQAYSEQQDNGLSQRIIIDCSHANSGKNHKRQSIVVQDIASRLNDEIDMIAGIMLESHLVEGKQAYTTAEKLIYGQSITDACIGWEETETMLGALSESVASALG